MIDFKEYSELYHFGVLGMHWGVRRYQNKDGSLTPLGQKHYNKQNAKAVKNALELSKVKYTLNGKSSYYTDSEKAAKYLKANANFRSAAKQVAEEKKEFKDARDEYDKKLKEAYKDEETFKKVINEYYTEHEKEYKKDGFDRKSFENWCLYDDGWQGSREDWYMEKYHKKTVDKLGKAFDSYKRAQAKSIEMTNKLIGDIKIGKGDQYSKEKVTQILQYMADDYLNDIKAINDVLNVKPTNLTQITSLSELKNSLKAVKKFSTRGGVYNV